MSDTILLITSPTSPDKFLSHSLMAEGFSVIVTDSTLETAYQNFSQTTPNLILIDAIDRPVAWVAQAEAINWPVPLIILTDQAQQTENAKTGVYRLPAPFSFQDLFLLVQNIIYQHTISDSFHTLQLSASLLDKVETMLNTLRQNLHATCVILSASSGWLIKTVGEVDQGTATSLAALMSASFSATARAAQILGHNEMFDSNLQESEGYGLYAVRLQEQFILSVAFASNTTIGMVRYYTGQIATDILQMLANESNTIDNESGLDPDVEFRQTINYALDELLNHLPDIYSGLEERNE